MSEYENTMGESSPRIKFIPPTTYSEDPPTRILQVQTHTFRMDSAHTFQSFQI